MQKNTFQPSFFASLLFIFSLLLSFTACNKSGKDKASQDSALVVQMRKTPCFGQCPTYEIKVFENGYVWLKGEKHIEQIGTFEAKIGKKELAVLKDKFEANKFWDLDEAYEKTMTDLPTTYLRYTSGSKSKEVRRTGDAPENLTNLEDVVADLLKSLKWTKIEDASQESEK
ncbi:DUF6438 domain-containing protein [Hugenholtzia roseola]|uniref:DUF6438 domain-containing protein n=1 Tax=Hugenholtzia roseola TaxID=1002 RepID=UPI0013787BD2|nr:DUF6438 domain-containing protein [Hugenholtzia roseola]